jgi:O-antigen/teichoic acid export membrane protein
MIARKSFLIVTTHFFTDFLGWIGIVVLAKLWGDFAPEAIGIIGFAMAFISLFRIVTDLGFSTAHIKRVSEGTDLGTCMGTFATIKIFLTALMVMFVFIAIFIWKNVFHKGFYDATTEAVVIVFLIHAIFTQLRNITTKSFIGTKEIAKRQITLMFENIVHIPLMILVAIAGVTGVIVGGTVWNISPAVDWPQFLQPLQHFLATHAVGSLAMTYVFGMMATFFVGIFFLRRYPWKKPSWELSKSYFYFALPMMIMAIITIISLNIDKVMIGYFWTATDVGYYFAVQRILGFITILSSSVVLVLFPTISEQHSSNRIPAIIKTTHLAGRYISMVMIPPIVMVMVFVTPVIDIILSDAFLPAAPVMITMVIWTFIGGISSPYSALVQGMNRPKTVAKIGIVMCITNICLNCLFIPQEGLLSSFGINGPTGAATATVLSALVGFFGLIMAAKRLTGMKLLQSHTPRHILAGIVMAVSLYYLNSFISLVRWYHLIVFAGMGLAIYIGVLFILKEFKKQDLHFFLDIIRPKEMIGYIKSELKEK